MQTTINGLTITGTPAEMAELLQLLTPRADKPKPAPKKAPEPKRAKLAIDMGKVKALRNAGWTLEKIADEMGCSPQTIANKLQKEG